MGIIFAITSIHKIPIEKNFEILSKESGKS